MVSTVLSSSNLLRPSGVRLVPGTLMIKFFRGEDLPQSEWGGGRGRGEEERGGREGERRGEEERGEGEEERKRGEGGGGLSASCVGENSK